MKRWVLVMAIFAILSFSTENSIGQCSICTKTAQQMGEKPARGLNTGIVYLMLTPFAIVGYVGYRWWRTNRDGI